MRFWIDEYAFSDGETTILREEIAVSFDSAASTLKVRQNVTSISILSCSVLHSLKWDFESYSWAQLEVRAVANGLKACCQVRRVLFQEAGTSIAVLAGETRSTFLSVKGYYAPDQWDIYWTGMQVKPGACRFNL